MWLFWFQNWSICPRKQITLWRRKIRLVYKLLETGARWVGWALLTAWLAVNLNHRSQRVTVSRSKNMAKQFFVKTSILEFQAYFLEKSARIYFKMKQVESVAKMIMYGGVTKNNFICFKSKGKSKFFYLPKKNTQRRYCFYGKWGSGLVGLFPPFFLLQ